MCGYAYMGKDALVSSWFWCLCSLPCAFVCGYAYKGKDCACLFVVLVPVGSAVRTCVRIRRMGKDCACLSVVLVLSAIARWWRLRLYRQGLRLSLRVSCARVSRMLTCPLWCSTDGPVSTCRTLRSPAVAVRRSSRDVSVGQQRQVRTVLLCIRQLHGWCPPEQLRCSFWGPGAGPM